MSFDVDEEERDQTKCVKRWMISLDLEAIIMVVYVPWHTVVVCTANIYKDWRLLSTCYLVTESKLLQRNASPQWSYHEYESEEKVSDVEKGYKHEEESR